MSETPVLYHYTSFEAFRKIMESERPRATHYSELNDWSELERGRELVLASLRAHAATIPRDTMALLERQAEEFGKLTPQIFIFSLSEVADSLEQWRAYCHDGGVAIGFVGENIDGHFRKASAVTTSTGWTTDPWKLTKCRYPDSGESIDVAKMIENADAIIKAPGDFEELLRKGFAYTLLEKICCSIKHPAYKNEKEVRCFFTLRPDAASKVRLSERNTRFVEISFVPSEAIKRVVISPHGDTDRGMTVAQHFKHSKGLDYEIAESKIPFRRM